MNTSNVPGFNEKLAWSEPDEKNIVMAAGPISGEFYFVQYNFDSVWAGLIVGERSFSDIVRDVTSGKKMCQDDLMLRRNASYTNSFFCRKVKKCHL